jgi:hypothetical protein
VACVYMGQPPLLVARPLQCSGQPSAVDLLSHPVLGQEGHYMLHTPSTLSPAAHAEHTVACCAVFWCGANTSQVCWRRAPQECGAERARCCCTGVRGLQGADLATLFLLYSLARGAA